MVLVTLFLGHADILVAWIIVNKTGHEKILPYYCSGCTLKYIEWYWWIFEFELCQLSLCWSVRQQRGYIDCVVSIIFKQLIRWLLFVFEPFELFHSKLRDRSEDVLIISYFILVLLPVIITICELICIITDTSYHDKRVVWTIHQELKHRYGGDLGMDPNRDGPMKLNSRPVSRGWSCCGS